MARIPAFQAGRVGSIPITRSKMKASTLVVGAFIFKYVIDGNRTRSNNKQSGGLFVRRGNERSEAIGMGVPRQIPITRSNYKRTFVYWQGCVF